MNVILLPGSNREDRLWVDSIERELSSQFKRTAVHYYDHWWSDTESAEIDLDAEILKLASTVQEFDRHIIIAHSEGVLLSLYAIHEGVIEPDVCVFIGSAINYGISHGFDLHSWLVNFDVPTLFIQNEHDPMMGSVELGNYLASKNVLSHQLVSLAGDTNEYFDVARTKDLIFDFYEV